MVTLTLAKFFVSVSHGHTVRKSKLENIGKIFVRIIISFVTCIMAYDFIGIVDFDFNEVPNWRQDKKETTTNLLSDIVEFYKKYEGLSQSAKDFCETSFVKLMTVKFVLNVNVGESVGTQTADGTRAVLDDYIENYKQPTINSVGQDQCVKEKDPLVTINVYKALTKFFALHEEMSNTGKLTVQQICDIHGILMDNLHEDAGEPRGTTEAFVIWNDESYVYPKPEVAKKLFYTSIDHHCEHMTQYRKKFAEKGPGVEAFGFLFKCAARLLFDFVDAHPFGDGNGRMCRLLANYVLSLITPFPVALYSSGEGRSGREDYLNAIVECRDHRDKGPGTLTAMLIEGTWRGWKSLFRILEQRNLTPLIPLAVVRKSDAVDVTNKKITEALKQCKVEVKPDMLKVVTKTINKAHRDPSGNDAVREVVTLSEGIHLYLHIYD